MTELPIPCLECGKATPVRPEQFGSDVGCGHCQKTFRVSQFTRVPCPQCHQEVRLRPDYIGERVTCKFCTHTFYVLPPSAAPQTSGAVDENQRLREQVAGLEAELHRIQNDLASKEEPSSRMVVQLEESPEAMEAKALRKELDKARAQVQRWRGQCQALEADKATAERLARELETIRGERDQLIERNKAHATETAQLSTKLADISRTMSAAAKRQQEAELRITHLETHRRRLEEDRQAGEDQLRQARSELEALRQERDAARAELATMHQQVKGWEQERESLLTQWHQDHNQKVDALEKRMREEQARALAEREQQLAAVGGELEQQRETLMEVREKSRQEADALRQERDAACEQAEILRRQHHAEQQALQDRLSEVAQQAQAEQERLQMEVGRSEAARRQLERDRETAHADAQRLRQELDTLHHEYESARTEAEEQRRSLIEDLHRNQRDREALRRERDAAKEQIQQAQQEADQKRQADLAEIRRDSEEEYALAKEEVERHKADLSLLRKEREALRRRIETMQQQARERAETWEDERKALLAKVQQEHQQAAELDKRFKAEQAATAQLHARLEAERGAAPIDAVELRKEAEALRRELEAAQAQLAQERRQNEQRGQVWTVEKRSLLGHHQDECRRLTEEFEQRLRVELTRCREGYEDQLEALQRERDAARSHFEALKQAVYHPAQAEEDDDIPRLPEPAEESGDQDRSAMEQRLIAEQTQLQAALRKSRQLLDDQKKQFEEERQALLAEVHRLRQKGSSRRPSDPAHGGVGFAPGAAAVAAPRTSRFLKVFLYVLLFLFAIAIVVAAKAVINMAGRR
jgi:chromosome segregation ATPase